MEITENDPGVTSVIYTICGFADTKAADWDMSAWRYLERLSHGVVLRVFSLMYLGRGDFDAGELRGFFDDHANECKEAMISQITSKEPLTEYLIQGVLAARTAGIDVNEWLVPTSEEP